MSEISDRYQKIADGFTTRLADIQPDQWEAPTPCTDWHVRDLVAHVIGTHRRVAGMVREGEPADVDPDGDLHAQWQNSRDEILAALTDPAQASTVTRGMFGEQTFESLVSRLLCADTLLHTWDLARATGQDERLDPDAVVKAREFLLTLDDALRRPGGFAPKIEPAPGSDEQTQLLNFCGRMT